MPSISVRGRWRIRRVLKWLGAAAAAAGLAVLIGSSFVSVNWGRGRLSYIRVYQGLLDVEWDGPGAPPAPWYWPHFEPVAAPRLALWPPNGKFVFRGNLATSVGRFPMILWRFPLWPVALAAAAAAAWLWGRDRRRPGCCAVCGYDLAGNASGVCPECGAVA